MTKQKVLSFIRRDIKKIKRERKAIPVRTGNHQNETTLTYLVTREHTLKEIEKLLQ